MTVDAPLTKESIPGLPDAQLRNIIRIYTRRGPLAWAVFIAEDELERRRLAERAKAPTDG